MARTALGTLPQVTGGRWAAGPLEGQHCTQTTGSAQSQRGTWGRPQQRGRGLAQAAPTLSTVAPAAHAHRESPRSPATAEGPPDQQALPPLSPHLSSFSWSRSSRAPSSRSSRCRARSSPQSSSARPCPAGGRQAVSPSARPPEAPHVCTAPLPWKACPGEAPTPPNPPGGPYRPRGNVT